MARRAATRRARRPRSVPEIDWNVTSRIDQSKVDGFPLRIVQFHIKVRGRPALDFSIPAEEAFDFHDDIGRAYDAVN